MQSQHLELHLQVVMGRCLRDIQRMSFCHLTVMRRDSERYCERYRSLKEAGLTVRVLDLTPYKDPDEFIKGLGAQALEERIRKAMSSFMFQVKVRRKI